MKNWKWVSTVAIFIALGFGFVACGGGGGGDDTVGKPTATPASGAVYHNTAVTLETATPGAHIYYTQNGTNPTAESTLYGDSTKPTITAEKLTLKAIAIKNGMNDSEILSVTYTIATDGEVTQYVTVAAVPFVAGTELNLQLASNNYSFEGNVDPNFTLADLSGITYTLSSTNPARTTTQLAQYVLTGKLLASEYADLDFPVVTQIFYYDGQPVGSRTFSVRKIGESFATLRDGDGTNVNAIPTATLTLKKSVTELP
jgi:hypothetical protein